MSECPHEYQTFRSLDRRMFGTYCLLCGQVQVGDEAAFQQWKDQWHGPPKPVRNVL